MTTDYHALTAGELLAALEMAGRLPEQDLIRACLERRAELTPGLLDMLTRPDDPAWPIDDPRQMAQIHAGLLLIAYREPLALPIFGALYREPDASKHNYVEWFDPELPAYGAAAVPMLADLLHDPAAPIMSRGEAAMILASVGRLHPETVPDIVGALRAALPPEAADGQLTISTAENRELSELWTWVAAALADLQDVDSQSRIEAMYRADLIDQSIVGSLKEWQARVMGQDQDEWLGTPKPTDILEIYEQLRVREAEQKAMQATFAARQAERDARAEAQHQASAKILASARPSRPPPSYSETFVPKPQTYVRPEAKVGRNEPCPCGSGRKYKHCHGRG